MIRKSTFLSCLLVLGAVLQFAPTSAAFSGGCWGGGWGGGCGGWGGWGGGWGGGDCGGGGGDCTDTTPPTIECPGDAKLFCGAPTGPSALGFPVVTDDTDSNPTVTWTDHVNSNFGGADRFDKVITRVWRAVDRCGNVATCEQVIDVVKVVVPVDVMPGQCPNVYVPDCKPVRVSVLGKPGFSVGSVVPGSVRLYLDDGSGVSVCPQYACFGDVSAPVQQSTECACDNAGPDGRCDLTYYFSRYQLNQVFHLNQLPSGTVVRFVVSGRLCNGCDFIGTDCLVIP